MNLATKERRLLDDLVLKTPKKLNTLFGQPALPDELKGACSTYSRILAEVLGEFGIGAEVKPVFIITANRVAINYRTGKISEEEAIRRGGRIQYWGDIRMGQKHQHAVCHISGWNVVVDLAMSRRASRQVPSHPYWFENKRFPWWLQRFQFSTYPLEYAAYETHPEDVTKGKEIIRDIAKNYYRRST